MSQPKPVDIYIRISRIGGREFLISDEEQEASARALAKGKGLRVGKILSDLDESGGKWDRPGLQEGLERVRAGKSGGLIVAWLDRLSRDSEHAHRLLREISEAGGSIYAPDAPADWTTPEGELQVGIVFAFAQYVRKRARAGFEAAKKRAIEVKGIPVNSHPPVGYRRISDKDRRLELDPETADAVRKVFETRARGGEDAAPRQLAKILEEAGVKTSRGSAIWGPASIYRLLSNRTYIGEIGYGRDRRYVNPNGCEPLVDLATWELAQPNWRPRASVARKNVLSGLLRCSSCRHPLRASVDSHGRTVYRCPRRFAGGVCPSPAYIRADRVEKIVLDDMWEHMPTVNAKAKADHDSRLAGLAQQVKQNRTLLQQWLAPEMQAQMIEEPELYADGTRERRERLAAAESAFAAEQDLYADAHGLPAEMSWQTAWDRMTVTERAALVSTRYDCIALGRDPSRLVAYPVGVGPRDLPRRGRRDDTLRAFEQDLPDGARELVL